MKHAADMSMFYVKVPIISVYSIVLAFHESRNRL